MNDIRRLLLKAVVLFGAAPSWALAQDNTKPPLPQGLKKRSKESVQYQDTPFQGRTCTKCMLYIGDGQCAIIDGVVSPNGWCNQWVPPTLG